MKRLSRAAQEIYAQKVSARNGSSQAYLSSSSIGSRSPASWTPQSYYGDRSSHVAKKKMKKRPDFDCRLSVNPVIRSLSKPSIKPKQKKKA
jgi:hypothetical protein